MVELNTGMPDIPEEPVEESIVTQRPIRMNFKDLSKSAVSFGLSAGLLLVSALLQSLLWSL